MPEPAPKEPAEAGGPAQEARRFGNYELLKELGRGAQGVVWLAEDVVLRRKVALKMLAGAGAQSELVRERFRREAALTSKFEHPGICGVHDFGEVDGTPYIAMQYVRGTTLATIVEAAHGGDKRETISIGGGGNKGELEDVLRLVERAARALHVAHQAGLVHRDIKPANIMVTPDGHPVVLDFGLARDTESEGQTLTQSGQILGTPAYLAPEQIVAARGTVDRRTDVYALGVTLFECLTLRRPFEGQSWDQLFHAILDGAPPSPRALNPRIPRELATVIEVAMERDQARRYPTAEAFAEDLRRVRSFEPIQAKAASTFTRLTKWGRRNPGRATAVGATALFVVTGIGLSGGRILQRRGELRQHLADAQAALVAADYVGAAVAVAKAQELDPKSGEVVELEARVKRAQEDAQRESDRKKDLAAAEEAREEELRQRERYEQVRRDLDALAAQLVRDRPGVHAQAASEASRAAFAMLEERERELRYEAERLLLTRSEALQRAGKLEQPWGGESVATQRALAAFHLERWREALSVGDLVRAEAMRIAIEQHDPNGEHRETLLGRGQLALESVQAGLELHLFRWESYASVREDEVIPRLVPVPTAGVDRVRPKEWLTGFHPGDPCLVVTSVEPGSIAARAGFARGDLVTSFAGAPCGGGVLVRDVATESDCAEEGLRPLARIVALDDAPVLGPFDWRLAVAAAKEGPCKVAHVPAGAATLSEAYCDPRGLVTAAPEELLRAGPPSNARLVGLVSGSRVELEVPAGTPTGLACEPTAYPLILAPECRVAVGRSITVDPGSYLVFARAPGFEDQRVNVLVERGARLQLRVELLPEGSTPPGYVYVPPGPFLAGGDPEAFGSRPVERVEVPGFFIQRRELTNREWYEFLNAPEILAFLERSPTAGQLYLPQDERVFARRLSAGHEWTWDVHTDTSADSPVLGISWSAARGYLDWRNRKAETAGEPWRYDLPTEEQWEKAARGVDGRAFPWGDRFDPALAVCLVRKQEFLLDAPGGFEPRDESPYGVLDLGGSREEFLHELVPGSDPPRCRKRGGHWSTKVEIAFRSASRPEISSDRSLSTQGLRLVVRRP